MKQQGVESKSFAFELVIVVFDTSSIRMWIFSAILVTHAGNSQVSVPRESVGQPPPT